jgi:hypothetical protein
MGHPQSMSSKQVSYRRVLARFVKQIPRNKGWWYRLPSGNTLSNDNQPLPTDAILPHLGHAFGLTELAMWAILIEMGCISQNSRSKTWGYQQRRLGILVGRIRCIKEPTSKSNQATRKRKESNTNLETKFGNVPKKRTCSFRKSGER